MTAPHFIIAGASKTGSVWLRECLAEHPGVFMAAGSPDYFSEAYERGDAWYRAFFDDAPADAVIGEKSTSYLPCPPAAGRIRRWNPNLRLVFVLRDPVRRAYSHYCMQLRAGLVSDRIEEELTPGNALVDEGLYFRHLSRFRGLFPDRQLCVLPYQELKDDAAAFLRRVFRFIGADPGFRPAQMTQRFHVTKTRPRFQAAYRRAVATAYWIERRGGWGQRMVLSLRKRGAADWFHSANRGAAYPELTADHHRRLEDYFADDTRQLQDWLGLELRDC